MDSIQQQFLALRKKYILSRFGRLNEMQQDAVFTTRGPLLILAGAGSGKTTVLVNRIANMILFGDAYGSDVICKEPTGEDIAQLEACIAGTDTPTTELSRMLAVNPVKPWNILAITFTNKAAQELKSRLAALLGEDTGGDVNASTFHSSCVRILRREADKLGFPSSFTIYDSDDQKRVLKAIYKDMNVDDKFLALRACASEIGRLKDKMLSPRDAAEVASDPRKKLIAEIYTAYSRQLYKAGAMDFDDLIYYTVKLFRDHLEVREFYQNRFRFILVDEYQDTSVAQFQLVNLLTSGENNVCVVGDDDQSIYRFRGATIENILSFEERFAGTKVIRLEQNYRSTSNILNAANCVIKNNQGRKGKTLWTDNSDGTKIQHYKAASEGDEAAHIAELITRNLDEGATLRDHCVLYRMNAQSSPVENHFARAGIPYKILGGLRFNDRKEVKDLHAYMSIIVNPADDLRLRRIINEPSRKLGAVTLDKIADIAGDLGVPMLEVVQHVEEYPALSRASTALRGFADIYEKLVQAAEDLPLAEFAATVPEVTGYTAMLKAEGEEGLTRLENIGQLVSNIKSYADIHKEEASLEGYLEEIALVADIDSYDDSVDTVILMTMHSAKGLEFPYVFIVGLEEGIFPSDQSRWSQEDVEEERRLCYVGITRAKNELFLSSAATRMLYGQTRRNQPSRFIDEIDPKLIDWDESPDSSVRGLNGALPFGNFGGYAAGGTTAGTGGATKTYLDKNYNKQPSATVRTPAAFNTGGFTGTKTGFGAAGGAAGAPPKPQTKQNGGVAFAPGDQVEHKVFGHGIVQKVTPVAGDHIIEIQFDSHGRKKTMANYAPLKKI